ncbi:MAG: protein-glutamate O-methyltransferase CheR [Bryobacterales bacterium]|nr:protein-glutamate O-methyltransferase CheR [Bryobacterales bacterium]
MREATEESTLVSEIHLSPADFSALSQIAYELFGLQLRDGKQSLVVARLSGIVRRHGFRRFREYIDYLRADRSGDAQSELINALTTNHTHFYRESAHFAYLQQLLGSSWRQHRRLRIWSAACSTGEEPYSILISLLEAPGGVADREIRVVATDIDTNALATATQGIYAATRVAELPAPVRQRYFLRGCGRWADHVRIKPQIASMVQFSRINLVTQFASPGQFEAIFCRNVMIYFSQETQELLVNRLTDSLEAGGYLFIGHAESLSSIRHSLRYVAPAIYQRAGMVVHR